MEWEIRLSADASPLSCSSFVLVLISEPFFVAPGVCTVQEGVEAGVVALGGCFGEFVVSCGFVRIDVASPLFIELGGNVPGFVIGVFKTSA